MQVTRGAILKGSIGYQLRRIETLSILPNETACLRSWRDIPGPTSLPIIGQLLHFLPGGHMYNPSEPMPTELYKKYGPIVRVEGFFGSKPTIFVFDAEVASNILRSENRQPIRPGVDSLRYYRKVYKKNEYGPDGPTGLLTE